MSILPGDTIRLNITGNDSTLLVDSWNSAITGPVIGSDNSTLVDTANNTLLGRFEGDVYGNLHAQNGGVVLNPGTNGTDAVFIGDVTGDVVGEVFGNVTGNLQGDVIDDNENVLLDATTSTLTINTINTQNISLSNDLTVVDLTAANVTAGNFYGHISGTGAGEFSGEFIGTFTGNVTGDIIGAVKNTSDEIIVDAAAGMVHADLVGNVTGDVTGDVIGDLTGSVTGNVTGDLTGDVTGVLYGDIRNANNKIAIRIEADDTISIGSNNNNIVAIGDHLSTLTFTANYREKNEFAVIPHPSGQAGQRLHFARKNADDDATSVIPGDLLDFKAVMGHNGTDYKVAGAWGYAVDPDWTITNTSASIRTIFGVAVADGTNQPDVLGPKKLSVNHEGIVGGYGFKANPISSTERNALTATAGMIIFNSSTNKFQGYNGSSWVDLG